MAGIKVGRKRQIALRLTQEQFAWVEKRAADRRKSINMQLQQMIEWAIATIEKFEADKREAERQRRSPSPTASPIPR